MAALSDLRGYAASACDQREVVDLGEDVDEVQHARRRRSAAGHAQKCLNGRGINAVANGGAANRPGRIHAKDCRNGTSAGQWG